MNQITPLAIYTFLTAITCFILSLFTILYRKNKFHRIWICLNLSIAGWALFVFLAALSSSPYQAYFFWRISHGIGIYVSIFFFHSVCIYCNLRPWRFIEIAYIYGGGWIILNFWNNGYYLYMGTKLLFNSIYYLQANNLNFPIGLSLWFFFAILGHCFLYAHSKRNQNQSGRQARLWMMISILGYIGGCSSFLPMFGINFYPHTMIFLPTYALLLSYAIFKYQFLNLRIVLEKSIVYSLLIATVSIAYLAFVITFEKIVQHFLGYSASSISLLSAFIIGIAIIPLRNKIQFFLDRSLFKGTQPEIVAENELLRREVAQSEKYKTLSTLASGVAHEVKNPLTAIKIFCEYLPQKLNDKEFLLKFSRLVGHEVDRIDGLVHELLDYGKPAPLVLKDTDINKLITDTLEILSSKFLANKITLTQNLSPTTHHLKVDSNQIKQALLNILLNAIDAMPTGGSLTVSTGVKGHGAGSKEDCFQISIQDTGPGISPEDLKRVFDPFFTKKDHGTGLGLAIVQGIMEQHRGKIRIESRLSVGTEVILEFPC